MQLDSFYFGDPRLVLIPVEHLTPSGIGRSFVARLRRHRAWSEEKIALFDAAFSRYWSRCEALSQGTPTWAPPRLRNVALLSGGQRTPPYVQLLNTSTWTLYDDDFDPTKSHAEFAAYLFAHGERMALSGEVSLAALRNAAYWFDRDAAEIGAFRDAARRSSRPDAAAFCALADALEWLPRLGHETLRPPANPRRCFSIPGTGLLVPPELEAQPPRLADTWKDIAGGVLQGYYAAWRTADTAAQRRFLDWLAAAAPPLLVTGKANRIVWDPDHPERLGSLRGELRRVAAEPLADIQLDLQVIADRSTAYAACADCTALPLPDESIAQDGYTYLYRGRKILAYNLHEPLLRRLDVPALPFARLMLGARAIHEWAHLAVEAEWVRPAVDAAELSARLVALAETFDAVLARAPAPLLEHTRRDLEALMVRYGPDLPNDGVAESSLLGTVSAGAALVRMIAPRLADYKANLLALRLQSDDEREAYMRQNIRSLRGEYRSTELWRMLARYVYEYQYLRFSEVGKRREIFFRSTWFDSDYLRSGALREEDFESLARSFARLCDSYEVDSSRFSFGVATG